MEKKKLKKKIEMFDQVYRFHFKLKTLHLSS